MTEKKKKNKVIVKKLIVVVVAFLYEKANNYQEELVSISKLHIGRGGFGFMSVCVFKTSF